MLAMLYVLLGFSVIVSLFGMVNTMVLSVFERTREIGMLRTIGMTRRQARRMIRHESVITALIGAAMGLGLGLFLSGLVTQAMSELRARVLGPRAGAGRLHAGRGRSPASARRSCPHGGPRGSTCWTRCTTSSDDRHYRTAPRAAPPSGRSRARLARLERPLLLAGLALVALHLLDLAFSGPDTSILGVLGILAVPSLGARPAAHHTADAAPARRRHRPGHARLQRRLARPARRQLRPRLDRRHGRRHDRRRPAADRLRPRRSDRSPASAATAGPGWRAAHVAAWIAGALVIALCGVLPLLSD